MLKKRSHAAEVKEEQSDIKAFGHKQVIEVEHFGEVGAGTTVEIFDHPRAQLIHRPQWVRDFKEVATVTVSGDSLSGEGIMDGDVLVVKRNFQASEIRNGRLVIALLPTGRSVVKRIHFEGDKIVLRSSNSRYKDMVFDRDQLRIDGIVKGLGWRDLD